MQEEVHPLSRCIVASKGFFSHDFFFGNDAFGHFTEINFSVSSGWPQRWVSEPVKLCRELSPTFDGIKPAEDEWDPE